MFSILIPTWNNLPFLKLCVESIQKNSFYQHQIVLHINEGTDGTLAWAKENSFDYTYSETNIGICFAVNNAAKLAKNDLILYMNDDMYVLPEWDKILVDEVNRLDTDCFMLSSTMIEPYDTGNKCVLIADFGRDIGNFKKEEILDRFRLLNKFDWNGSTWPPALVHRKWWNRVGGYSEEFSPGMGSDNDFAMKMWQAGCRIYKGVGKSRVYHFISKSTGRVKKNNGRKQFLNKWGIRQSTFDKYYLLRGKPYQDVLHNPKPTPGFVLQKLIGKVKQWIS